MRYLCLIYTESRKWDTMSLGERRTFAGETRSSGAELRGSGYLLSAQALQPPGAATTVRVRSGRVSATEGPATEAGEHLCGFAVIDARDLNEAIQVAARMPEARLGRIEVRPIRETTPTQR